MSLQINTQFDEKETVWNVELKGEIDIYTANELKETFARILNERNENIRMHCSQLEYIDSTGLGVLIGALKRLKSEDKNIIIKEPRPNISKLLNITGLNKIFIIEGE